MNNLYVCLLNDRSQCVTTSRLRYAGTAQEFYDEMADGLREKYGAAFVYVSEIPPLTPEINKRICEVRGEPYRILG